MKTPKKLTFNIITVVIVLIVIIATLRIISQYQFGQQLAISAVQASFETVVTNITTNNRHIDQNIQTILSLAEDFNGINEPASHQKIPLVFNSFIKSLQQNNEVLSIYIGHDNGDFIQLINTSADIDTIHSFQAPKETKWIISTISSEDNHQSRLFRFYNKELDLLKQRKIVNHLIPSSRIWYKMAIQKEKVIKTDPYYFQATDEPGITYAKRMKNKKAVIAIDVTTLQLNLLLVKQKPTPDSEIFIYKKEGKKSFSSAFQQQKILTEKKELIDLTIKETLYIIDHPILYASNEMNWSPFDYSESGVAKGYSIDLLKLVAAKTNLQISYVNGLTWGQLIDEFKQGRIDIMHSLFYSNERAKYGLFTEAYYSLPNYFITRDSESTIQNFNQIKNRKVAVIRAWKITQFLKKNYPKLNLIEYSNVLSAVRAVSDGEADVFIDSIDTNQDLLARYAIHNLKFNHQLPQSSDMYEGHLRFMVQKKNLTLQSIINKTLASLTIEEKNNLIKKWHLSGKNSKRNRSNYAVPQALLAHLKEKKQDPKIFQITVDNQAYYTAYRILEYPNILGIMVPKKTLMAPYYKQIIQSIIMAIIILIFCLPLIYYFTIKPIKQMTQMSDFIKKRQYNKVKKVHSFVNEYTLLSNSLVDMATSIYKHEKLQKDLFSAVIRVFAETIDEKSPYTAKHCGRVPVIAKMLLDATNNDQTFFKDFKMQDEDDLRAYELGTWLHDCGKITTPEHIINKATKLEVIYNRIHEIRTRFEVLWRDEEIIYYQALLAGENAQQAHQKRSQNQQDLINDFAFIAESNIGGEFMSKEKHQRVEKIAKKTWIRHFDNRLGLSIFEQSCFKHKKRPLPVTEKLLDNKKYHLIPRENFDLEAYQKQGFKLDVPDYLYNHGEVYNLCIERGTLTTEERFKINEHIIMTIKMLEQLPFPSEYNHVVEYAGTHHETMDGTGYPRKLCKADLSIPARIMIIADVFEALTASDRPYKKAKTLSESLAILSDMRDKQHLDADLFELFLRSEVYLDYAKLFLDPAQIDEVNIENYLN